MVVEEVVGKLLDWASWFMEGWAALEAVLDFAGAIRLSISMLSPEEFQMVLAVVAGG